MNKYTALVFSSLFAAQLSAAAVAAPTSLPVGADVTTAPATPKPMLKETDLIDPTKTTEAKSTAPTQTSKSAGDKAMPSTSSTSKNTADSADKRDQQGLIVDKKGPQRVEVIINENGEESRYSFSGAELKDRALIDNRLSAHDNDNRAAVLKAIDEINSGTLALISPKEREKLHELEQEMASRQEKIQLEGEALARRGEELARIGESIAHIVSTSVQQRDLDGEGKRMLIIHQAKEGEVSLRLHHMDEDNFRFEMMKTLLGETTLSDQQKEELKALLTQ